MRIIFCDSVLDSKIVEPDYKLEWLSAQKMSFQTSLINFEELNDKRISQALSSVPKSESKILGLYRGWMLTPAIYQLLYDGLLDKNIQLINSPTAYRHCHFLPESYENIKENTPQSNWTLSSEEMNLERICALTDVFGTSPIIVKDYVKSEKHSWKNACFIPNASDKKNVMRVVNNFLALRGDFLNEGLVFRKFEELEFLTQHSQSAMPLTKEFRIFFAYKKVLNIFNYWDEGEYGDSRPQLAKFVDIAQEIESNFFTMDVALKKNGTWIIMELGDGQVAGLPDNADRDDYYQNLYDIFINKDQS